MTPAPASPTIPKAPPGPRTRTRTRPRYGRGLVLLLAAVYFIVPLGASLWFSVDVPAKGGANNIDFSAYTQALDTEGFTSSLLLSVGLALCTVTLSLLLMVPTTITVALHLPRLRRLVETLCMLPLILPPIALVAGVSTVLSWGPEELATTPLYQTFMTIQNPRFPLILVFLYVIMSLPFMYRSLDAGLRAVDLRTLVEASRSLGAGRLQTLLRVILPNLKPALVSGSVLTLAMVLGEFTVASVQGFRPFAVWIVQVGDSQAQMSVAVSVISVLITWGLLLLLTTLAGGPRTGGDRTARNRTARNRTGGPRTARNRRKPTS
ncbi:ABC transporter permease [Streptomyces sp. H27-D2]|uniref:ABC transporter permease n=1 Tax=Streptomyces sp. H27-D2 TaxID=3046304 RepID=UPI003FA7B542